METRLVDATRTARHPVSPIDPLFEGPGEMRALCRELDWSATPLGPPSSWATSLRAIVRIVLGSRNPMFLFWGPDLIQIYNDAYRPSLGLYGGRHPRALGARGREFWTDIWGEIGPQIDQVLTTGEGTWHEDQYLPIERNDRLDDVWWTYSYGPAYDDDGRVNGVLVVCQETTKRVLAERDRERLLEQTARGRHTIERILDQIADEHLTMDSDFRILTVNRAALQNLGMSRDELVGRTHWEVFPAANGTPVEERYRRVMSERVEAHFTHHYVGEGYDRYLEIDAYPTDMGGMAVFWRDISARVRAENEQLRSRREIERLLAVSEQARAEAEAANRVKAQFLTTMSHELRTPLNAIGGYTELLQMGVRGTLNEDQAQFVERIQVSQRHLLGLINGVLNFAKLETGAVRFEIADTAVLPILAAAQALVEPQARSRGLTLEPIQCEENLFVHCDAEKLRQIVVNLLSNAVKFTESGSVMIRSSRSSGMIRIDVSDTGIGIAEDALNAIFDPFVQVHSELTRPYEGTGLGLAISRDLARGMGGDIAVSSTPGRGSTFTLTLPAV